MKRAALWVTAIGLATGMGMASAEQAVRKDVDIGAGTVGGGNTAAAASPTRLEMGTAESMENPAVIFARKAKQAQAKDLDIYYGDFLAVEQVTMTIEPPDNEAIPQMPWPEVQPPPRRAPKPINRPPSTSFHSGRWLGEMGRPSRA